MMVISRGPSTVLELLPSPENISTPDLVTPLFHILDLELEPQLLPHHNMKSVFNCHDTGLQLNLLTKLPVVLGRFSQYC
jgi:hypothetical protein